jgi:hypothetical protein
MNNSIVETMKVPAIAGGAVSLFGTPPGLLQIPQNQFISAVALHGIFPLTGAEPFKFDPRDIPNIRNIGVYSALAQYLLPSGQTENSLGFKIEWTAYVSGNLLGVLASIDFTVQNLNEPEAYATFPLFSSPAILADLAAKVALGCNETRLNFTVAPAGGNPPWRFAAYGMPAAFSAAILSLWVKAEVEHTFPLIP